jgi:hypothetical protein
MNATAWSHQCRVITQGTIEPNRPRRKLDHHSSSLETLNMTRPKESLQDLRIDLVDA